MDIRIQTYDCDKCEKTHEIEIDFDLLNENQKKGLEPILNNYICPNIYLMYRVFNFNVDLTLNLLKQNLPAKTIEPIIKRFKDKWGESSFDEKLDRFKKLDLAYLGIPEEYFDLLQEISSSYCCGYFYPAMTSAGALGERILNRLIIKLRDYYKSSKHYKKIHRKNSFDQWELPIEVLKDWNIITEEVAELFLKLKEYRNYSIHYNEGYNFEFNSHDAIKTLSQIIDLQFNYMNRKDLFWIFDVPGEIWLKSTKLNDLFVKEFILPHCLRCGPFCEPMANPPIKSKKYPLKPFTDEEFIELRKNRNTKDVKNEY